MDMNIVRPEYEISEEFQRVEPTTEYYELTIDTMDRKIIKIGFDDFVQPFTAKQAAEVARCIFEALSVMKESRLSRPSSIDDALEAEYEKVFNKFVAGNSARSKNDLMIARDQKNYLYMSAGAFVDPEPSGKLLSDENASYDISIASETGESLEMRIGKFSMVFFEAQALWVWFHLSLAANCLTQYTWRGNS
ncbi:hypothetical protein [Pseudomonas umsongensis]